MEELQFEQKLGTIDKSKWNGILLYAEQNAGKLHPIVRELIGESKRLAEKVSFDVYAVIAGGKGTKENAEKLIGYGVKEVFVYEDEALEGLRVDTYTGVISECIASLRPSIVLIGGTEWGRSLAPRLSTRFNTGLTADCTSLDIEENTDLIQVRPAFGGNIMAQIRIGITRPQFATVRYRVMDAAQKVDNPTGKITVRKVMEDTIQSHIQVLKSIILKKEKSIEEEEVLVVAGRGAHSDNDVALLRELAEVLNGQLCFTRPMVEDGYGDVAHQIGLSGRTVKPRLIITCGVSGSIQFTSCMSAAENIVAINKDPQAQIFQIATHCIVDDLREVVPCLIESIQAGKVVL